MRCPSGHYLDEQIDDVRVETVTCEVCAAERGVMRAAQRDVEQSGVDAADLLDGKFFVGQPIFLEP